MTFPITDEALERACEEYKRIKSEEGIMLSLSGLKSILQAALDRRVGDKDRRKVRDDDVANCRARRQWKCAGRRKGDTHWLGLPRAEPPIPVSPAMEFAGVQATFSKEILDGFTVTEWRVARQEAANQYRAMRAQAVREGLK